VAGQSTETAMSHAAEDGLDVCVANAGAPLVEDFLETPGDHGHLALFLASEQASFITGQVFVVDGGRYAGRDCALA
jgi:NAD(P)-dependent dehydrogenase (short-subunit alcohol dehydrogenase family)